MFFSRNSNLKLMEYSDCWSFPTAMHFLTVGVSFGSGVNCEWKTG